MVLTHKKIILSDRSAMKTELVEKALEVITDPPLLINLVSKRVQQLNSGRSPLITMVERMGTADIALTEIIEGKIVLEGDHTEE
tara:strand:- start:532 stop:783 length:252 start_codon:yes stop_codon:yes gene_type:complete